MLINDRFDTDPLRNEITDKQTGKINRIEPRLMKLLCFLAESGGKPVSRKMIVKEVWNDYPGGDEGLNQAISVLRKLLDDNEKKIIETLPKIGYCFHGKSNPAQPVTKSGSLRVVYISAASLLLLMSALVSLYYHYLANNKLIPGKLSHEEAIKAFKLDSKSTGKSDSKGIDKTVKMDSLGKLDSKESDQPGKTDKQKGQADSQRK